MLVYNSSQVKAALLKFKHMEQCLNNSLQITETNIKLYIDTLFLLGQTWVGDLPGLHPHDLLCYSVGKMSLSILFFTFNGSIHAMHEIRYSILVCTHLCHTGHNVCIPVRSGSATSIASVDYPSLIG